MGEKEKSSVNRTSWGLLRQALNATMKKSVGGSEAPDQNKMLRSNYQTTLHMKQEQMSYKCAATWGRFALPHTGHCSLIEQCLAHADYVDVHLSAHEKNNSYGLRELLLKVMLRNRGVDLRRVNFYQTSNVNEALKQSIANAPFNEVVFVLGSDQQDMLFSLSDIHDVNFVINRRENSSTNMRYFLDSYDFIEDARYLYEDCSYSTTLAYMLRAEERNNEKSSRSSKKVGGHPCKDAYIESSTECTSSVV